eukprot:s380_g5.t1
MSGNDTAIWSDIRVLYQASASLGLPVSSGQAFHVALDGRANFHSGRWLVPGHLMADWMGERPSPNAPGQRVLVAVSEAIYQSVVVHSSTIRVLQARVLSGSELPIIDTCSGLALVAGAVLLQRTEVIEVAELFCGGFNGWSQGLRILRTFGYDCRMKWLLDTAEECFEGSRQVNPGLRKVYTQEQLLEQCFDTDPCFVCASLEHTWWAQGMAITQPQVACVSAPCQPWSVGGQGSGLEDAEGRLLLHLFGQLSALQTPVVVMEQVPGFRHHPHYDQVCQAWQDAGYVEAWSGILDLIEIAPVTRKRFLLVLVRQGLEFPKLVLEWPILPRRPTIGSHDCILRLPYTMHADCVVPDQVLAIYLDPWFMPPSRHPQQRQQSPQSFRLRGPSDRAACFVAQYHFQHELSERTLERAGLYGVLLELPHEIRFFSGAEIALLHGAVSAVWLPKDDRIQMRLMGNSISPFHAVVPLSLAFQVIGPDSLWVSTAQAILQSMSMRMRASEMQFVELPDGWIMCKTGEALQHFLESQHSWQPRQLVPDSDTAFCCFACKDTTETCLFVLAPDVAVQSVLHLLGHEFPEECFQQLCPLVLQKGSPLPLASELTAESELELDALPDLPLARLQSSVPPEEDLLLIIGRQAYYALLRSGPHFLWGLAQVMTMEGCQHSAFFEQDEWFSFEGSKVLCRGDLRGIVQLRVTDVLNNEPWLVSLDDLSHFQVQCKAAPPRLRIAGARTLSLCRGFPVQLFAAWGWAAQLLPSIQADLLCADIAFIPCRDRLRVPETDIFRRCAQQIFVALLRTIEQIALGDSSLTVPCKVQVQGHTLWFGERPADGTFGDVGALWEQAHTCLHCPQAFRVFSGPKQVPEALTLQGARQGPVPPGFLNSGGWLLVSVMPETRGGGAKDAKFRAIQTDLAQLFLDKGLSLGQTSASVDKLLNAAGVARLQRALDLSDATNRWLQIQELCRQFTVSLPDVPSGPSKAAAATSAEARRRLPKDSLAKACDFTLFPGFFKNSDGSAASVLSQLMPGASGVYMCDHAEAKRILSDWAGTNNDELGLVVLGHACPAPASCQGRCGVPAGTAAGDKVILHACWHNLGKTPLHVKCDHDASVDLPEAACICATVYRDEFSGQEWQLFTANPVRSVSERLRTSGSTVSLESPWGRSFRKEGRASTPGDCDSVQFHCRIQNSDLLQLSGVYITPKTWQGDIAKGYAVVWAPGDKDEIARLCLQVADPLGLVRSKKRFGVRVAEPNFEAAWAVLRPNQAAPPKVEVTGLYKLLSAPPQLRSADIQDWAQKMNWTVRPLRCLSPGQWLLGAQGPPPSGLLSINQQVVLIQTVEPRATQRPIVQAGKLSRALPSGSAAAETEDPLTANDPWRTYLSSVGRAPAAPTAARTLDPPNQQRYDLQEVRLQKLEAGLDEVRRGHTAMAQQLSSTQTAVQQQVEQVKGDLSSFARDFQQQLQANAEAQRQAQVSHQAQMQTGIDEIKAMLLAPRASQVKRPAESSEMENDL